MILETDGIAYLSNGQKKLPLQPYEQYILYDKNGYCSLSNGSVI